MHMDLDRATVQRVTADINVLKTKQARCRRPLLNGSAQRAPWRRGWHLVVLPEVILVRNTLVLGFF